MAEFLRQLSLWALPILAAIVLHEVSHGWVAQRLGDPTAARLGRLTLNPLPHIDPVGTVLLPGFLLWVGSGVVFGWARPVPVNDRNLRDPVRDPMWVAAAGPATNFALAAVSALVYRGIVSVLVTSGSGPSPAALAVLEPAALMARNSVLINVVLGVFNLLPLPPLDGGRVVAALLPRSVAGSFSRIEPYGMLVVVVLLVSGTLGAVIGPVIRLCLRVLS